MEPVTGAALIGAGTQLVGSAFNAFSQGNMNKKNRKWNEQMYQQQLKDNKEFWAMQNSYNSPEQQMNRLREAGLSPNLAYGNGTVANTASAPNSAHVAPFRGEAPQLQLPDLADRYMNIATQQQRLSNEKMQGNLMAMDLLAKEQDVTSKRMLNAYMDKQGYTYRGQRERDLVNLGFEKYLAANALNAFNFGGDLDQEMGIGRIRSGSAYDLQAKGLELINRLRSMETTQKGIGINMDRTRNTYLKRQLSGSLGDMGAKDWLNFILRGAEIGTRK